MFTTSQIFGHISHLHRISHVESAWMYLPGSWNLEATSYYEFDLVVEVG